MKELCIKENATRLGITKTLFLYNNLVAGNNVNSEYVNFQANSKDCYLTTGGQFNEQVIYGNHIVNSKDSVDLYFIFKIELGYDDTICQNSYRLFYSQNCENCVDSYFLYDCKNCQNCFGCVGLRNKQYHIFNKPYSKEEYEKLVPKIIEHMNEMPYISQRSNSKEPIVYKYGEFFPPELSPFAYNETIAQEYFPLSAEAAAKAGYHWKEPTERNRQPTTHNNRIINIKIPLNTFMAIILVLMNSKQLMRQTGLKLFIARNAIK